MKTFRELYCERHGIAFDQFEPVLLRKCLHWPGRWMHGLLALNREYFALDYEFIRSVGDLRSRRGYRNEAAEYHYHPRNRDFLRKVLLMRVSAQSLQALFEAEIVSTHTVPPFSTGTS